MVSTPSSHFKFIKKYLDSTSASTDSKFGSGIDEVPSLPNALGIDKIPPTLNVPSTMEENFSNSNVVARDTRSNRKAIYGFPFLKIIWSNVIDTMKNSYQALKLNSIPTSNSRNTNQSSNADDADYVVKEQPEDVLSSNDKYVNQDDMELPSPHVRKAFKLLNLDASHQSFGIYVSHRPPRIDNVLSVGIHP